MRKIIFALAMTTTVSFSQSCDVKGLENWVMPYDIKFIEGYMDTTKENFKSFEACGSVWSHGEVVKFEDYKRMSRAQKLSIREIITKYKDYYNIKL